MCVICVMCVFLFVFLLNYKNENCMFHFYAYQNN
jgi:hypothetical protein